MITLFLSLSSSCEFSIFTQKGWEGEIQSYLLSITCLTRSQNQHVDLYHYNNGYKTQFIKSENEYV